MMAPFSMLFAAVLVTLFLVVMAGARRAERNARKLEAMRRRRHEYEAARIAASLRLYGIRR